MDLKAYLPEHVLKVPTMADTMQALSLELDKLDEVLGKIESESIISKAGEQGLGVMELEYGLAQNLKNEVERKERLKAKLRGAGTTTPQMIKETAKSFDCGDIAIEFNAAAYTVKIRYVSKKGIPTNEENFKAAIREIIPAHLVLEYYYTYTTWRDIKTKTWADLKDMTWAELSVWKEV